MNNINNEVKSINEKIKETTKFMKNNITKTVICCVSEVDNIIRTTSNELIYTHEYTSHNLVHVTGTPDIVILSIVFKQIRLENPVLLHISSYEPLHNIDGVCIKCTIQHDEMSIPLNITTKNILIRKTYDITDDRVTDRSKLDEFLSDAYNADILYSFISKQIINYAKLNNLPPFFICENSREIAASILSKVEDSVTMGIIKKSDIDSENYIFEWSLRQPYKLRISCDVLEIVNPIQLSEESIDDVVNDFLKEWNRVIVGNYKWY